MSYATELSRITRRLDASAGRRVARRNALRELDTLLRRIRRECRRKYPSVGKDGQEITPTVLPRGERKCPTDGAYVPTPGAFAKHVAQKHGGICWCGFTPSWNVDDGPRMKYDPKVYRAGSFQKVVNSLRGHFARVKDNLTSHLVYGAIKELGRLKGTPV